MPLFIVEYAHLARDGNNYQLPTGMEPAIVEQPAITMSGASAASVAFNAQTTIVMIHAQEATCIKFGQPGTTPTAVTTAHRLAAGETRFYGVRANGAATMKVAGILGV